MEKGEREKGISLGSDAGVIQETDPGLWAFGLDKSTEETWLGHDTILKCSGFLGFVLDTNE